MIAAINLKQHYTDDSSGIYASGDGKGTTAQAVVRPSLNEEVNEEQLLTGGASA